MDYRKIFLYVIFHIAELKQRQC